MNHRRLNRASHMVLAAGVLITLGALVKAGGGVATLLNGYTLWTALPYAVLLGATRFADRRGKALAALAVCLLASGFALWAYVSALRHTRSTSALVFLFVPLYQLIGALIVLAVLFALRHSGRRPTA